MGYEDFNPSDFDPPDIGRGETYIKDDKILRMKVCKLVVNVIITR